jgi:hypothetical protein
MADQPFPDIALRVLRTLRKSSMDGYTLKSEAKVHSRKDLAEAVRFLLAHDYLIVEGDISEEEIGRAFMQIPLQVRGRVDDVLRAEQLTARDTPTGANS